MTQGENKSIERGLGKGKLGEKGSGAGPGGNCICPNCKTVVVHQAGVPCFSVSCPKCGSKMVRA